MADPFFLKHITLFKGLSDAQITSVASIAVDRAVSKGQVIFAEGKLAEGLYIVLEGRVKIYKATLDGREAVMHIFGPGEPFGEVAVFQNGVFPASAMALEPGKILFLSRKDIVHCITGDPALALNMLATLSLRLQMFTRQVEALTLHEIPRRLAVYLLHISTGTSDGEVIRLDISKHLLAGLLGTARESLSRAFARLVSHQVIAMEGRMITIMDKELLAAVAKGEQVL